MREFKIPQIPFAFEFECNWPNGNLATVCHQIVIWHILKKLVNNQMAIQSLFVIKLPFLRFLQI